MVTIVLDLLALSCALAMVFYIRSARHRQRFVRLIESDAGTHPEALALAEAGYRKDVHGAIVYGLLVAVALLVGRVNLDNINGRAGHAGCARGDVGVVGPHRARRGPHGPQPLRAGAPGRAGPRAGAAGAQGLGGPAGPRGGARTSAGSRSAGSTRRARGSWRATSSTCTGWGATGWLRSSATWPATASSRRSPRSRPSICCGCSCASSATRPQALEEINAQLAAGDRNEEFISACVVVFDTEAGTLRYSSAGTPGRVPVP